MAQFGVTSALVSIVLSMFMAGLGLGSWGSGVAIRRYGERIKASALGAYAVVELMIGISALIVPYQLLLGRRLLNWLEVPSSPAYYAVSGAWIALTLIPWCACMGATIPIGMWAIRRSFSQGTKRSFSFLYLANVFGAGAGATLPPLLVEVYGFRHTLRIGAMLNGLLFVSALALSYRLSSTPRDTRPTPSSEPAPGSAVTERSRRPLLLLFTTGLTSMGAEVVWIRLFTPYLGTLVYAFALILGVYLASTFVGSRIYRYRSRAGAQSGTLLWAFLAFATLLPLAAASQQFVLPGYQLLEIMRLVLGIAPFSGLLGFVTPMLVDHWSGGDPDRAGRAYAVNVVGCILGPLLAGFVLLPLISDRWVLLAFAAPWLAIGLNPGWAAGLRRPEPSTRYASYGLAAAALILAFTVRGYYEDTSSGQQVLRDNTATVVASGEGMLKHLAVNGTAMTYLTPMTKLMAHLPMAFLDHPPSSALVVCFGMGTTYRSLMSWNTSTTAVELVPSVPQLFWYFHADGPQLLRSPLSHVVIDDGRRYLERTAAQYDVITIDPPPPVSGAGISLLYSKEFYSAARRRLTAGGILQQWLPRGDAVLQAAVARAVQESFPYVRVFHSLDNEGFHILASEHPIVQRTAQELAERMPPGAAQDLIEWGPAPSAAQQFAIILGRELPLEFMTSGAPRTPALHDDRPQNEYFFLRVYLHSKY
ncbi:putative Spermidine synthase [Candidatus Sulfotelmatobacter kueseliae]|uniref:Putative Spermidine synthase n=1 Tax=Candidatus Sulfotelmatobacter kueseliae TaxID=2042962 RepID=A0A2U3KE29_9BACT|nr:putative Spermidine synthase [Candidatus Sulfotelmatobacter kueseliae]